MAIMAGLSIIAPTAQYVEQYSIVLLATDLLQSSAKCELASLGQEVLHMCGCRQR